MRITVLNDDRNLRSDLKNEHGFSLWIQTEKESFLFDAGQSEAYLYNAEKLGVNLNQADFAVLSHGDYDHGNGLKFWNGKKIPLYLHPDAFTYRTNKKTGNYAGLNQTEGELSQRFQLIQNKTPVWITPQILFLGEIPRREGYALSVLPMNGVDGNEYAQPDDSALALKTERGLVVITGCGHSGVCNVLDYAKKLTHETRIYAVLGGFHLKDMGAPTAQLMDYCHRNGVTNVYLSHCTEDIVCAQISQKLSNVQTLSVGEVVEL
ncbi:MAG: MBL fold metallo-hydrolase [Clostridiales bacterium]|nr:MBL fold metallo-hydrolase [Clostridiales bacterium]